MLWAFDDKDEAEVIGKIQNLFVVVVLMLVSVVGASPTFANSDSLSLIATHGLTAQVQLSSDLSTLDSSRFIEIGKELSEPPVAIVNSITVKQLPAVPATFCMALAGFVCVSLVRDRKIWLRIVFETLCLGAAGVNVVPQLLANSNKIKVKQSSYAKEAVCELGDFARPTSDAQVTRYIGLLRRVAIPGDDSFTENHGGKSITVRGYSSHVLLSAFLRLTPFSLYSYLSAIINSNFNSQFSIDCSSAAPWSWICLSRVFVPVNRSYFSFNGLTEARFLELRR